MVTSCTGFQACSMSSSPNMTTLRVSWCSMAVKSRPSTLISPPPEPPKKVSTRLKTSLDSNTKMACPRKGSILKMCRLVGTGKERMNSPNLTMSTLVVVTSTILRRALDRVVRNKRAKRSLMISRVGMRPLMMRSWLVRS